MPSPVLHFAVGGAICLLDRRVLREEKWRFAAPVMAAAILPDFDVLPGLLVGDPNRFHGGGSHSLFVALCAGLLGALFAKQQRLRVGAWVCLAWLSHALLDALAVDGRPPYGVPLFWPFSSETVQFYPLFLPIRHGLSGAPISEFFAELLRPENVKAVAVEGILAVLIVVLGWRVGTRADACR